MQRCGRGRGGRRWRRRGGGVGRVGAASDKPHRQGDDEHGGDCTGTGCLKNRTFDTTDQPDDRYCDGYDGAKGETAATIIDKSSRSCGISQKVLTDNLRELEHDELIVRKVYAEVPPRVEYSLTELGCSLQPVIDAGYSGWFMIEAEQDPAIADPFVQAVNARAYLHDTFGL